MKLFLLAVLGHVSTALADSSSAGNVSNKAPSTTDGQLHASLDPKAVKIHTGNTTEWGVKLSCGTFQSRGHPHVSVVWTSPTGQILNSTSYGNGVFSLVLHHVETGLYSCQIDPKEPALALLGESSALLESSEVFVDGDLVRFIVQEATIAELKARIAELEAKNADLEKTVKTVKEFSKPSNCRELQLETKADGVQQLTLKLDQTFDVYCDSAGWTVIQRRRLSFTTNFNRNWTEYEEGFGDVTGEFWLGLKKIYAMTRAHNASLRVDLVYLSGNWRSAFYDTFYIDGPDQNYRLHVAGYSGTAGDGASPNMPFSTRDRDHDQSRGNCVKRNSGWWYYSCYKSSLNSPRPEWYTRAYGGLKWAEMKIKPRN